MVYTRSDKEDDNPHMTATASLLRPLDVISHETTLMLKTLDGEEAQRIASASDQREAKRRVLEIRARTQELFEWISEAWLEEPRN